MAAGGIAGAGVLRLVFGVGDFCRDTAMAPDAVGLAYPRAQLVIASRAAGIAAPIDSPTLDDHDLEDDTARSPASGMTGMLCIRSDQETFRRTNRSRQRHRVASGAGNKK